MIEISKELLSEVLGYKEEDYVIVATEKDIFLDKNYLHYEYQDPYCTLETYTTIKDKINIYELAHKNLKQWAKINNVFDKINWLDEPDMIFKKTKELIK